MSEWTGDELERVGGSDELRIASLRADATLGSWRTIWVVRVGDDLYVRSVRGRSSDWFRAARLRHEGRIRSGGVEKDVTFVEPDDQAAGRIDAAYREKYRRYPGGVVGSTLTPEARSATLRLVPRP
ncbi:MAG TPA: DUF2255 family protein [Actinomycetota bacterium]|jgi:hypothetical protein